MSRSAVAQTLVTNPAPFVTTNLYNGPTSERLNIVVLGDGYTSNQLYAAYQADVTNIVLNYLLTVEPYRSYQPYFNVFSISAASLESGADHPETGTYKDTYFNSTFDSYGIVRLLTVQDSSRVYNLCNQFVPDYDIIIVIVNDSTYGGSGGAFAVTSVNSTSPQITVHELGHSFGSLVDEYDYATPGYYPYEAVNCTAQTNRQLIKWTVWIDSATPVPTPNDPSYDGQVGLFEGCMYTTTGWYRPHYNSCMRALGQPYGQVNIDQLIKRIYYHSPYHIAPFQDISPTTTNLTINGVQTLSFSVLPMQPVSPSPNLGVGWFLDGTNLPGQSATNLAISSTTIGLGQHAISCVVSDPTPQVRIYTNAEFLVNPLTKTVTWNVNIQCLNAPIVSPASYDFGELGIGTTTQTSFVVTNTCSTTLHGTASVAAPFAIVSGSPFTVPSYGRANVAVSFTPPAIGSYVTNVVFTTDDGNSTNWVTGAGVCSYTLSPTNGAFGVLGGDGNFTVNTPDSSCAWTPSTTNGWIHLTAGTGPGTGPVNYTVDENTIAPPRQGTIIVQDQTYTVTQAGCSYALSSGIASPSAKGGTNTVNVITTSPCPWTATPNNAWLTILNATNGVSSGTVTYIVAPNGSSNARTGTVSIADQTFTVIQAGNTAPQVTIMPITPVNLPVLTVNLHATVTDDGAPSGTVSTAWSKVSGGSVTFGNVNATNTTATFTTNGTYVLRLTASDGALSTSKDVTAIVNARPQITSPPAATNELAWVDNMSVVAGYDPACFTVGAFDPDFNPLYCRWDFGDSGISTDCDPCHVFTNCGQYAVSVEVSDGVASTNATSTVVVACELYITKLQVKLNFAKTNSDSCTLAGAFDPGTGLDLTNKVVTINVGGAQVPFTMDAKGKGKGVSRFGSCKLAYNQKIGLWKLTANLAKGSWHAQWSEHGLSNATISKPGASVAMPAVVVIDTNAFADERSMVYTATKNQSGTAK